MLMHKIQKGELGKRLRKIFFSLSEPLNATENAFMKTLRKPILFKIKILHTLKNNSRYRKIIEKHRLLVHTIDENQLYFFNLEIKSS